VEGPEALEAVYDEADHAGSSCRVWQGSGGMLLTQRELAAIARFAHARAVDVSLFARPVAAWDTGAASCTCSKTSGVAPTPGSAACW
jgi:hypothetical protein